MDDNVNPYEPPKSDAMSDVAPEARSNIAGSVLMVVAGALFFGSSAYFLRLIVLGRMLSRDQPTGLLLIAFFVFYGLAGLFACVFHSLYLLRGWPRQGIAGLYAIGLSLVISTLIVVLIREF